MSTKMATNKLGRRNRKIHPVNSDPKLKNTITEKWTTLAVTKTKDTENQSSKPSRTLRSARARLDDAMKNLISGVEVVVPNLQEDETNLTIWQAAMLGNTNETKKLLDNDPFLLNSRDILGATPLHYAVRYNRKDVVQELLERGSDPNRVILGKKITALHMATRRNFTNIVRRLIRHGAMIGAKDENGKVPLHVAAHQGNVESLKLLLYSGADVNICDNDVMTPLHLAAQVGNVAMCELLLMHGAKLRCKEISNITPVMFAAICGSLQTMMFLIDAGTKLDISSKVCMEDRDDEGSTALHLAVARSHIEITKYCLKCSADINAQKNNGYTPLHLVAVTGNENLAKMLIERDADVIITDNERMMPLHRAAMYNRLEVMECLINSGTVLEGRDIERFTPLLSAAWKGQTAAAKYLIEEGAKIDVKDSESKNCLHWAAYGNHLDLAEMLLENGGCVLMNEKDKNEMTPTHIAAETGNVKILRLLIKHGCNILRKDQNERTPLHLAANKGHYESLQVLAETDSTHINDDDIDGNTPLLLASKMGHSKAVTHLLRVGADVASRDESRRTSLALAAKNGHADIVKILLKNHADIDTVDKNRNTPLHLSASHGHSDVTELLLYEAANPLLKNSKGENCLDSATEQLQDETATVLVLNKRWQEIISQHDKEGFTTFNRLIEKLPNVASIVLDKCVRFSHSDRTDPNLKIIYNYRHVDPGPASVTSLAIGKKWTAFKTMISWKRRDLLTHDVCRTLLDLKWQKFGRGLFFLDFIIYLSFLSALTALCFVVPNIFTARLDEYGCPLPVGSNTSVYYDQDGNIILTGNYVFDVTFVLQLYIAVYVVINVIREFFELIQTGYNYFMEISNWVDWAMYSTALYFIFPPGHSPCVGQWKSGSFAIFCAWLDLILYFRRISMFGVYVVMFFKVLKSFVKIVILFLMFVIAFSFALHMMYFDMDEFSTFWRSLVKVCVMSVGELDYGDLFYGREHKEGFIANPLSTPLYILFLFLMPILLMNLLLGVAVGDIDEVQKRATLEKIEMEVNMLEQMEDSMPTWLQRRLYTPQLTYEPYSTSCSSKVKKCFSRRNVDLEKRERIMQEAGGVNAESLQENIEEFRSSVVERQKLMTQMMELNNSVLMKMAEKLDVKFDEAQFRAAKDLSN